VLIIDTGVLVAAADRTDPHHRSCADLLEQDVGPLRTTAMVIAEAAYLLERDLGVAAEAALYDAIIDGSLGVETLTAEDWIRIRDLVRQYHDFPLGGTDASLMAIAERLDATRMATLNHRHFAAVRPAHAAAFDICPR
jgi:hypothetical protein